MGEQPPPRAPIRWDVQRTDGQVFRFIQYEFPRLLGPADGRYLVRDAPDADPGHVVVLATEGAPRRRAFGRRPPKRRDPQPPPEPVPVTRASVIDTNAFSDADEGERWLRRLDLVAAADRSLGVVNRVLHAERIAHMSPYIHEVGIDDALVIRAGYGDGDRVADGRWIAALELPPAAPGEGRRKRSALLGSQERVAALLGARERELACEELALRARSDVDGNRLLAAMLGVSLALEAACAELGDGLADRVQELESLREEVDANARAALDGTLAPEQAQRSAHALRRIEAALRARVAASR